MNVSYVCEDGHTHETGAGNYRSLLASAKAGRMGDSVKRAAKAGEPFVLCPNHSREDVNRMSHTGGHSHG